MQDDFYSFDEESYSIIGKRYKKRYRLGDEVMIKVKRADLVKKQLDFGLFEDDLYSAPRPMKEGSKIPNKRNKYKR
jgi:hypothetical protein